MRSYEAARTYFSIAGFGAWSVIIIGTLVALVSAGGVSQYAGGGAGFLAMLPGFGIMILGFLLLVFVQIGRASVDTAEYTQQMLQISRDQLEVSRQGLKQSHIGGRGFEGAKPVADTEPTSGFNAVVQEDANDGELEYSGHAITQENGKYYCANMVFSSLSAAHGYIDQLGINSSAEPVLVADKS